MTLFCKNKKYFKALICSKNLLRPYFIFSFIIFGVVIDSNKTVLSQKAQSVPPSVIVEEAKIGEFSKQIDLVGRIEAEDKVDIKARGTGILGPRLFKDGDLVKSGQVLFQLEKDTYELEVIQKEASVKSSKAKLANAKVKLDRTKFLTERDAMSKSQLDQTIAEHQQAEAELTQAEADLESSKINLAYTSIKSPINGRVGRALFSPGNLITPQSDRLTTVVSDQNVRVVFAVPEKDIFDVLKFKSLKEARAIDIDIALADGSIITNEAKLDFGDVSVDSKSDSIITRAVLDDKNHILIDGMTVHVIIKRKSSDKSIIIPHKAIAIDQNGAYCMVVNSKNVVEQRSLTLGPEVSGKIVIEKGLQGGDRVIIAGFEHLQPGMAVTPVIGAE